MIFFEHAFKRTLKQKWLLLGLTVFPLGLALAPQPATEVVPIGFSMYGLLIIFSAFLMTKQILEDRMQKTIVRIAAAPVDHKTYLLGHLGAYLTILMVQNVVFVIMTVILWRDITISYGLLLIIYILFTALSITFTLFWHMLFKSYATSVAVFSVIINILAMLGGLIIPLKFMPSAITDLTIVLPTYWLAYGLQALFDQAYGTYFLSLSIIIAFAIIFLVIGSKRRLE